MEASRNPDSETESLRSLPKSTIAIAGSIHLQSTPSSVCSSPPPSEAHEESWHLDDLDDDVALLSSDIDGSLHLLKQSLIQHVIGIKRKIVQRLHSNLKIEKERMLDRVNSANEEIAEMKTQLLDFKYSTERSQQIAAKACVLLGKRAQTIKTEELGRLVLTSWRFTTFKSSRWNSTLKMSNQMFNQKCLRQSFSTWRNLARDNLLRAVVSEIQSKEELERSNLQSNYESRIYDLEMQLRTCQEELEKTQNSAKKSEQHIRDGILRGMSAFQKELSHELFVETFKGRTEASSRDASLASSSSLPLSSSLPFSSSANVSTSVPLPEAPPQRPVETSTAHADSIDYSCRTIPSGHVAIISEKPLRKVVAPRASVTQYAQVIPPTIATRKTIKTQTIKK
ncbi:hypothetical protein RCL1_001996 [Eukaryota sp. TZLM3-RCL]